LLPIGSERIESESDSDSPRVSARRFERCLQRACFHFIPMRVTHCKGTAKTAQQWRTTRLARRVIAGARAGDRNRARSAGEEQFNEGRILSTQHVDNAHANTNKTRTDAARADVLANCAQSAECQPATGNSANSGRDGRLPAASRPPPILRAPHRRSP